jgi:hypothetical protein
MAEVGEVRDTIFLAGNRKWYGSVGLRRCPVVLLVMLGGAKVMESDVKH